MEGSCSSAAPIPTESRLVWWSEPATGAWRFEGVITQHDMGDLLLDPFDLAVIAQPARTAADVLLSAEIVFRQLAKQAADRAASQVDTAAQQT